MKKNEQACDTSISLKLFGKILPLWILLVGVLLLASFLRLYHLDGTPPSPYWEETALGYDAYSLSKTGKDFHGNPYPILSFSSFGDYKPSGYFYALVPFIKLLGLNTLAVRMPSAVAGILTTALLFFIGKELFDERVGLLSSLFFAVSPWSLQFSRGGWEVNLALMFVTAGGWLLLVARRKAWVLPLGVLMFGFSMYTYHAARVFAPLVGALGGILLLRYWWKHQKMTRAKIMLVIFSFFIALGMVAPFIVNLKSSSVSSRFDATSVFTDPGPVLASNAAIQAHGNTMIARILYHRYWFYSALVLRGFIAHFSPTFLFVRGDGNLRHSTVAFGLLYPLDVVFIIIALWHLLFRRNTKIAMLVVCVLFAAAAPSLVTPTPHALRFLFALPSFTLLTAFGVSEFTKKCQFNQLRARRVGVLLVYVCLVSVYLWYYHTQYAVKAASDWQYGYKQMYEAVGKDKKPGEKVFITREQGRPSMYYLFYSAYDPATLQKKEPSLPKDQLELLGIDDYSFVDAIPQENGLFVTSPTKVDPKAHVLDTIKSQDGKPVWIIWRR